MTLRHSLSCLSLASRIVPSSTRYIPSAVTRSKFAYSTRAMSRLQGKCVFITGASAGIGEACAREFGREGSHLILTARRFDRLENLKKEITAQNPFVKIHCAALDVRCKEEVEEVVKQLPTEFAQVDVLVNNAGLVVGLDHVVDVAKDEIDVMFDTNVKGLLYMTQVLVPGMKTRKRGHVINISSVAGKEAYPGGSVYCATKHAVEAITKSLRFELMDTPIRVSSVAPGLVETEFSKIRFRGDEARASKVYEGLDGGPLTGQDIAETVTFIASRPEHVQIADVLIFPTCICGFCCAKGNAVRCLRIQFSIYPCPLRRAGLFLIWVPQLKKMDIDLEIFARIFVSLCHRRFMPHHLTSLRLTHRSFFWVAFNSKVTDFNVSIQGDRGCD